MFGISLRILATLALVTGAAVAAPDDGLPSVLTATTGTYECSGHSLNNEAKMVDLTAHLKVTVELGGSWLHEAFTATKGGETGHAFDRYTTFDPTSKKLKRMMLVAGGDWYIGDATACAASTSCKIDWVYTAHNKMGEFPFKEHVETSDKMLKSSAELSVDGGKTWMHAYDMTCRR